MWNRTLSVDEITQLYQRGASRLKFQFRTCTDSLCTGEPWLGPDNSKFTYFSELNNNSAPFNATGNVLSSLPSISFSNFIALPTKSFFQYRTTFESESANLTLGPELKSINIGPTHYYANSPSIYSNNGISFSSLNSYIETLGSGGCPGGIGYNLSVDKINWYYWNTTNWVLANGTVAQSNDETTVNSQISSWGSQFGSGQIYVKAYLKSNGVSMCELDNIQIQGNR